jgi:proline iminopeptidase
MKSALFTLGIILLSMVSCKQNSIVIPSLKEGYIPVTGGKVWYHIVGADKKGIPLLTLHGGPGAPHDYFEPLETLADERPVIFYDQLGCGKSDRPSDTALWTVDRFVEELDQVRSFLKLSQVHLLGGSWGTMLGVEYMLRKKPEGIVSMVLSGPFLSTPRWMADQQMWISQLPPNVRDSIIKYEENKNYAAPGYQDAMMAFYREHVCRLDPWPDCLNRAFAGMGLEVYQYMWGPSEFTVTGTLKNADVTDKLHQIKISVLFTCGEFDEATPATTRYYQSKITGSEVYVFNGASHEHPLESEEEYLKVVGDFLKRSADK